MTQPAKAQDPSMEEILASIRRIISDDETKTPAEAKPASVQAAPVQPRPEPPRTPPRAGALNAAPRMRPAPSAPASAQPKPSASPPPVAKNSQNDIDAMLAGLDAHTSEAEVRVPDVESDVFELTEQMTIPDVPQVESGPQAASFQQVHPQDDLEFSEPRSTGTGYQTSILDTPFVGVDPQPARSLMSSSTMASVESAFHTLAGTVLSNNARTLEDLVMEMLRPMLKSWLDDNLPNMVERIVRAEIERVSRSR